MVTEYVKSPFLDAKGKPVAVGAKAPDESEENLAAYRSMGLIGTEAEVEKETGMDVGRPGKAAARKARSTK